jgi:hypothetical protein
MNRRLTPGILELRRPKMRKLTKAPLYPPDDDRLDARPRGISGATITSWDGPPDIDLDALFSKSSDQVSLTGAASAPVSSPVSTAENKPQDEPLTFATIDQFATVTTV